MVYRTSISKAAFLAFLAACFVSAQPKALAGDKIEFSAPPDILAVPHPERTVKLDPAASIRETLSSHHVEGSDFSAGSAVTIVIPAPKSRDHFGWTPPFGESQDQDADTDSDLFAPRKTVTTHTNSWNNSKDSDSAFSRDRDREKGFSREGSWMQPDEGFSRFGTDSMLTSGGHGEDWLARRFDRHTAPDWARDMASQEPKEFEQMRKQGYTSSKEDFSTFYNSPMGGSPQNDLGSAAEMSRKPGSSGILGNAWSDDSLRGQSDQQVMMQPATAPGWDQLPTPSHPNRISSRDQTFAEPSHTPYAPAVLAFPKRPGDLFQ